MDRDNIINKLKSKELNYWDEAAALKELLDTGMSQREIVDLLGIKQPTLSNKIRLLKLPLDVQKIAKRCDINEHSARDLLKINDPQMQLKIVNRIVEYGLRTREAKRYIDKQIIISVKIESVKEFIQMVSNGTKTLKSQGVNIKSGKADKEGYTDILIRIYQ